MSNVEVVSCIYLTIVCVSTSAATVTRTAPECPKCAVIKKSGKPSCCAPGGAWFENCGTSDSSNTDHTWAEGLQACKDVASLLLGKVESRLIIINQKTTKQQLNVVENLTTDSTLATAYDTPAGNFKDNDQLSLVVVFTSVSFIVFLNIRT